MRTYISAAHVGGQGKTTVAQILYSKISLRRSDLKLVSADYADDCNSSKLGKLFPNKVLELGTGAKLNSAKFENDSNAPLRYWDNLGEILLEGQAVVDVGANVASQLIQWAKHRRLSQVLRSRRAPEIDFFLTTKAEKHAIENAASLIGELLDQDVFPIARLFVVRNEVGGPFVPNQVETAISAVTVARNITYITLPRCTSELWHLLEKTNMPVNHALSLSEEEIGKQFDIDIWTATAGLADLKDWSNTVNRALDRAGL